MAAVAGNTGRELAWIDAEPGATLVTGTFMLLRFAGKVIVDGTVATVVSLELRLTTSPPAGAGAVSTSVRLFVVAVP